MKCSLRQHIDQLCIDLSSELPSYLKFLDNVVIARLSSRKIHILPVLHPSNTYLDFLDTLIAYLVSQKSINVLASGYKDSSMDNQCNSRTMSSSSNFAMNYMRNSNWSYTFQLIGAHNFLELVINYKGFSAVGSKNSLQVFGDSNQFSFKGDFNAVSKNRVLNRSNGSGKGNKRCLLPREVDQLLSDIFPSYKSKPGDMPKSFRKIRKTMLSVISRDQKLSYNAIYSKLIGYGKPNYHKIERNRTPLQLVVRLCLVILCKLLSLEIWGGSENKKILQSEISNFIRIGVQEKVHVKDLLRGIKLSDFKWLGTTEKISSKQDFELRKQNLIHFLNWIFETLIKRVITAFWYVTESQDSNGMRSSYFPHHIWACITSKWLSVYIRENLVKQEVSKSWSTKEVFNIGFVRPVPKKIDFRFICIPSRGNLTFLASQSEPISREKDRFEFIKYNLEILQPISQILRSKLNRRSNNNSFFNPKCRSSGDVASFMINFRKSFLNSHQEKLPKLFLLKFDMKHCYDRLNQKAILKQIEGYFHGENENTPYYFRRYVQLDDSSFNWKKTSSRIHNSARNFNMIQESGYLNGIRGAYLDKVKTTKLLKRDIISICKNLIFDSQVVIRNEQGHYELYRRKRGVFQGFPLSGTFCDIVYSAMVEEKFNFLQHRDSKSLFLRLADDFLLISTEIQDCIDVRKIIDGQELHKFGAHVNIDKTLFRNTNDSINTSIKFVGLDLDLNTMEIKMEYPHFILKTLKYRSFKTLLTYLYNAYKTRLHGFLMDLSSGSIEGVLWNLRGLLEIILVAISHDYKRIKRGDAFSNVKFINFLKDMRDHTITKFVEVNNSFDFLDIIISEFNAAIVKCLGGRKEFGFLLETIPI